MKIKVEIEPDDIRCHRGHQANRGWDAEDGVCGTCGSDDVGIPFALSDQIKRLERMPAEMVLSLVYDLYGPPSLNKPLDL